MKARSLVLTAIFCLFLCGPCLLWAAQAVSPVPLPGWLTAEDATYLSGGIEKSNIRKTLSLKGFTSEKFQAALETAVGNHIPMKAQSLLLSSSLQRSAIVSSNTIFGFKAYPTFFGSETAYGVEAHALTAFPKTNTYYLDRITQTATGIAEVASRHPEKNFYLVASDISDTTAGNPLIPLVSGKAFTTSDFVEAMKEAVRSAANVHVVSVTYDNFEDYYKNYYTTDHHWNGFGTLEAYRALAPVANLREDVGSYSTTVSFGNFPTNGSYAREGLMLLDEIVQEPQFDLTGLAIDAETVPPIASKNSVEDLEALGMKAAYSFYPQWYGTAAQTAKSPVTNTELADGRNAVVLMDSFADSLHWLLARNYRYLRCYRDIRDGQSGPETLEERIAEVDAEDIYFVGSALAYSRIPNNFPNYFN